MSKIRAAAAVITCTRDNDLHLPVKKVGVSWVRRRSRYEDLMCCSTLGMKLYTNQLREGRVRSWGDQSRPSSFPAMNPTQEGYEKSSINGRPLHGDFLDSCFTSAGSVSSADEAGCSHAGVLGSTESSTSVSRSSRTGDGGPSSSEDWRPVKRARSTHCCIHSPTIQVNHNRCTGRLPVQYNLLRKTLLVISQTWITERWAYPSAPVRICDSCTKG